MTDPNQPPPNIRLRLVFAKKEQIKYISHLDLALAWERALRRAQIPLAYSQGFNPRPKMQFASGLALGTTGAAELLDIFITEAVELAEASARIQEALPAGIGLRSIAEVPLKEPATQQQVRQAEYRVVVETELSAGELARRIDELLAADELLQTRRRKKRQEKFDLRPLLHELSLAATGEGEATLHMRVTTGQFGNLRPEAVLEALDLGENWAGIERTRLIFEDDIPA